MLVEGLPVLATTLIILIGKVWDAVTDPIMGRISDRTRSRFGRRRIYFLAGIVPVFLSFVMLFYSFGIQSVTAKIVYHAFAYMFFGTAFTVVMVPYNAILSDMTDDYNERTSYTTVRMCFSGGTSLLAAVLPGLIINAIGGEKNIFGSEKRLSRNGFGLWFDIRIVLAAGFFGHQGKRRFAARFEYNLQRCEKRV